MLTPLYFDAAERDVILVDRGWIPFSGFRDKLPDVSFAGHVDVDVTGRVDELPMEGLASGRAAPDANAAWPKVTSYPHPTELSAMLRRPIEPRILLLDARRTERLRARVAAARHDGRSALGLWRAVVCVRGARDRVVGDIGNAQEIMNFRCRCTAP